MLTLPSSQRHYQHSALKKLVLVGGAFPLGNRIQMTADVSTSLQLVVVDLSCDVGNAYRR